MDEAERRRRTQGTAIRRAKWPGFRRHVMAAVAHHDGVRLARPSAPGHRHSAHGITAIGASPVRDTHPRWTGAGSSRIITPDTDARSPDFISTANHAVESPTVMRTGRHARTCSCPTVIVESRTHTAVAGQLPDAPQTATCCWLITIAHAAGVHHGAGWTRMSLGRTSGSPTTARLCLSSSNDACASRRTARRLTGWTGSVCQGSPAVPRVKDPGVPVSVRSHGAPVQHDHERSESSSAGPNHAASDGCAEEGWSASDAGAAHATQATSTSAVVSRVHGCWRNLYPPDGDATRALLVRRGVYAITPAPHRGTIQHRHGHAHGSRHSPFPLKV